MSDPTESRDDSDNLKPCPFCGGAGEWNSHEASHSVMDDPMAGAQWIECMKCGASTNLRYSLMDDCKPLLLEQWNRRALPAPPTLAEAVLSLNSAWNAKEPEDSIASKLDLCRRLALNSAAMGCLTCNGHGLVGCMTLEGGEGYECPDCQGSGAALLPPGRGMVPMTEGEAVECVAQVLPVISSGNEELWHIQHKHAVSIVRGVERFHGIKEGSATPLGDGEGAR